MTVPVDQVVTPLGELLLDCFRTEIDRVARPPQVTCLRPGDTVELLIAQTRDECCEGLGWVRLVTFYPSTTFPAPDTAPVPKGPTGWAVVLEMGAARCAPVAGNTIPSCATWTDATLAAWADAAAMRRALCCFSELRGWRKVLAGQYQPLRVEGGCLGGTMQVTVAAPACDCIEEEIGS